MAPKKTVYPDPKCPPKYVREISTGRTMPWTPLFRRKASEFEVYYRPNTDDKVNHMAALAKRNAAPTYPQLIVHDESDVIDGADG